MKHIIATLALVCGVASPAAAQDAPAAFVRGFGGITFLSETAGIFGAGAGVRLGDHVEAIGELGHITNILPRSLQRDLDTVAQAMGAAYGGGLVIDGRAPSLYGFGGMRAGFFASPRVRVYLESGVGAARGTSDISARVGSLDVSSQVTSALRIKHSETRALVMVGGGVELPLTGNLGVDLGYRYMRIFTEDPRINTATMAAGLRWGF